MNHMAMRLMWVFLAAPWLTWVIFHPLADARLGFALVANPREARTAVMEMLHKAYDVPPFSYVFDAVRPAYKGRFPDAVRGRGHGASRGLGSRTACFTAP